MAVPYSICCSGQHASSRGSVRINKPLEYLAPCCIKRVTLSRIPWQKSHMRNIRSYAEIPYKNSNVVVSTGSEIEHLYSQNSEDIEIPASTREEKQEEERLLNRQNAIEKNDLENKTETEKTIKTDNKTTAIIKVLPENDGEEKPTGFFGSLRKAFGGKWTKERFKALGIGAAIAYGFVSCVTYSTCIVIAWLAHVKKTGSVPIAPGQWKSFLVIFAGLYTIQNIIRPIRFCLAVALTPVANSMMAYLELKLKIKRLQSFIILFIGLAVFTISCLAMALWLLGGIPARPPNPTSA